MLNSEVIFALSKLLEEEGMSNTIHLPNDPNLPMVKSAIDRIKVHGEYPYLITVGLNSDRVIISRDRPPTPNDGKIRSQLRMPLEVVESNITLADPNCAKQVVAAVKDDIEKRKRTDQIMGCKVNE